MKKLILLGLAIILFASCQKPEQRYFAESAEIEVLKAGIVAYESGDWDTWKGHFSDTAKIYVNSETPINTDTRLNELKGAAATFSSYGFDREDEYIEMVIDKEKETWVYYWAQWNGVIAANSNKISVPVHLAIQFTDGKMTKEHIYFDSTQMNNEIAALADMTDLDKKIFTQIESFISNFLNKQDASVLDDVVSEDYVRYMNDVKVATGASELQASLAPFFSGFSDFNITLPHKSDITDDNSIFVHWEMTGTNDGEFAGAPATGKKVKISGLSRLHFNDDGKMDEENVFFDQLNLLQQLGQTQIPSK